MSSRSRTARLLAGLLLVVLLTPLVLSTRWVKAWVFTQAATSLRSRYGLDVRATTFDYSLASLRLSADGVTLALAAAPDRPIASIPRLEIDFAASALGGRLNFDRIRAQGARIAIDSTTWRPTPAAEAPAQRTALPTLQVGIVELDDLDLALGDADGTQLLASGLTARFDGHQGPNALAGTLAATGGIALSFGSEAVSLAFDRADARVALGATGVSASLTASSPVASIRAEGSLPLALGEPLHVTFEGDAVLEQLHRWWPDAPAWNGRAHVAGRVSGDWQSPEAFFHVAGRDLEWSALRPAAWDASGRISRQGLAIEAFSLASQLASLDARGVIAFDARGRTEVAGRWHDVGADLVARLLGRQLSSASRSALDGSATLAWTGIEPRLDSIEGQIDATLSAAAPDRSARGTLRANGGDGRWRVHYRQALEGSVDASFEGEVTASRGQMTDSAVSGSVAIRAENVAATFAQLRRLGVTIPEALAGTSSQRVAFDGSVAGTLVGPRLAGTLTAVGVRSGAIDDMAIRGDVALDAEALEVAPLQVESARNRATLRGILPWSARPGHGTIEAHIEALAEILPSLPPAWAPRGAIDVGGEWMGSGRDLVVTTRLSGTALAVNGVAFESWSATASLAQGRVALDDLRAAQPEGTLTGSGSWDFAHSTVSGQFAGTNLTLALQSEGPEGALDTRGRLEGVSFEARVAGPQRWPDGVLTLTSGAVEVGGQRVGSLSMRAEAEAGVARISAQAPQLAATAEGRLSLEDPWPFDGRVAFRGSDVAALARLAGASEATAEGVNASLDATIEASGPARELASLEGTLSVTGLAGTIRGHPVRLTQPGRLQVQDERVRATDPVRLTWGTTSLALEPGAGPAAAGGVSMSLEGPLAELTALVPEMLPKGVAAEGSVKADVLLTERVSDLRPTGRVAVTLASLTREERQLARDTTIVADVDAATVHVREVRGTVLGGPFEARGSVPIEWIRSDRSNDNGVPAEPAAFWLKSSAAAKAVVGLLRDEAPEIDGTLNLTVEGSATAPRLDAIRATLRDDASRITIGAFTLTSAQPAELRLEAGLLHVDRLEWRGPRSAFTAAGSVGMSDGVNGRLTLTGDGTLALLSVLVPARVDGRTRFDLALSGPPGQRELLGTIAIADGSLVLPSWRLAMADWSGSVVLEAQRIDLKGLRGQFNGGEATVEGAFPIGAGTTAPRLVEVAVRGAFLDLPRGLRSQIDANLEWHHSGATARLTGHATVTARAYREPATEVARIAAALIDGSRGKSRELPAAVAATSLDVRLSTVGPLAVANSVARVELVPDLQLTGTVGSPALRGQIAVEDDGRIQFGGRQYRLRDSRVEFSPDRGLVPSLAVSGETRVSDYTVFLRLSGTADQIETTLSSDPPLGERDLQTLLVTGQRESPGRDRSSDENAVGAMSGDMLGMAGQYLGFDAVTVSTTDDLALVSSNVDPALRLTVSKRIGRRFELVLSDNLDDNELTWVIIYRPRPGFEFRALSRDNTEYTGEFRQEIQFGPGVSPPRPPPRPRVPRDRVAEVTLSGDSGFPAADVLSATSLRAGDEFEFSRWLEDRDRIAALYRQRGYFAARIVPTRQPLSAGGGAQRVALDYRVTRGERTVLVVSGYSPPADVEERLQQAWADTQLLDLLNADLSRVMRDHLADRGFLRATVEVELDESQPDLVKATVRVDPGPRTTERLLAFTGNTALSDTELIALEEANRGPVSPWRDPAPLLEVIQAAYAARGYLAVTATAGAMAFTGSAATLPIVISEGPQARVTSIAVTGADRVPQAEAAAATGLAVGGAYVTGNEQTARAALERYYRNLGYRDVAVDLRSTVNAGEGRVEVAVTVKEGARYVVRRVQTSGIESTREATVERAVRIEPGAPASPAVADATRRRLYDVGTFRSAEVTFAPVENATPGTTVPVDAVVTVQESRRFLLLYGIEATNQYQSLFAQRVTSGGVAADLRDRNFLGRGWTLGAGVSYEPSFRSARLLAAIPRLGSRRIRTNLYVEKSNEERARTEDAILVDNETTASIEQRWRPRTPVELSWGYQFNRRDLVFRSAATDQTVIDIRGYLASLTGSVVVDRRDNMFDAKRGWLVSGSAEWGLQPLGSDFDYLRTAARASYYLPVGALTLASNVRWSDLLAISGQPPLSALDLFFTAGGTQTVRGYKQDSLSAYNVEVEGDQVALGGTKLLVFNEELRFPLFWLLSGAAFVDAGNTFTLEKGIILGDLAVGAGFGLRIRTPLAPVRLDLGFPVSSRTGQTGARWHFSIGQIF